MWVLGIKLSSCLLNHRGISPAPMCRICRNERRYLVSWAERTIIEQVELPQLSSSLRLLSRVKFSFHLETEACPQSTDIFIHSLENYSLSLEKGYRDGPVTSFEKKYLFYSYLCRCVCVPHVWVTPDTRRSIESIAFGLPGGSEPSDVGAGNGTWVVWKSNKCSSLLSHLSSPFLLFLMP